MILPRGPMIEFVAGKSRYVDFPESIYFYPVRSMLKMTLKQAVMIEAMNVVQLGSQQMTDFWFDHTGKVFNTLEDRDLARRSNVHAVTTSENSSILYKLFDKTQNVHPWINAIETLECMWR